MDRTPPASRSPPAGPDLAHPLPPQPGCLPGGSRTSGLPASFADLVFFSSSLLRLADCFKPGSFDGGAPSDILSAGVPHEENRTAHPKFRAPGGVVLPAVPRHIAASRRNQQRPRSTPEMNAPGRCEVHAITHVIASRSYALP